MPDPRDSAIIRRRSLLPSAIPPPHNDGMAPPRRRWLAWTGLTAALALAAVWLASLFWSFSYLQFRPHGDRFILHLEAGVLAWIDTYDLTSWPPEKTVHRFNIRSHRTRPRWAFVPTGRFLMFPIWLPFLSIALPTAYLLLRRRRPPPHCCQTCGYNLTGNTTGVCPECGRRCV